MDEPFAFALPSTKVGSEIVKEFHDDLCPAREEQIYTAAAAGQVPKFLRNWMEVSFEWDGLLITFYCLPDFFCVGTDDDYVYTPMNPVTAERIGKLIDGRLPTPRMVELMYEHGKKMVLDPMTPGQGFPWDGSMKGTYRWPIYTNRVRVQKDFRKIELDDLVEGHFKNVVVSQEMEKHKGRWLGFFGGYSYVNKPIQNLNYSAHGVLYADYSHGVHYVHNEMVIGDNIFEVAEVLAHPTYAEAISNEGALNFSSYHDVHKAYRVTELIY